MKVRDIVTEPVIACSPEHEFRQRAAEITWSEDCGALPGIEDGKPAGILRWTKRSPQGLIGMNDMIPADRKGGPVLL